MSKYEYLVSESATADRQSFTNLEEAFKEATALSKKQSEPIYIDVYNLEEEDMADFYYTVTSGTRRIHK